MILLHHKNRWKRLGFLVFALILPSMILAQAQEKPQLSEAIREAIEVKGAEEAKNYFMELDKPQREQYEIDMERISELINSYLASGNIEAVGTISEITPLFMQDLIAREMNKLDPEMAEMLSDQQKRSVKEENQPQNRYSDKVAPEQERVAQLTGEPREDLERFTGLYGVPGEDGASRRLWVSVSCDGYLVTGAMWGDASPWWMRSEGDHVFTFGNSYSDIRMEFREGADEGELEMIHNLETLRSPLVRMDELPEEWGSCIERMQQ